VTDTPPELDLGLPRRLIEVIARLRRENGLTLEELADRSGLHRTSLGLMERGERGLSIGSAGKVAEALGLPLSGLIAIAEATEELPGSASPAMSPRRVGADVIRNETLLLQISGLEGNAVRSAVEYTYDTFDLIDTELIARGSEPIAGLVELANLSSMIGNLLGAGIAAASDGAYVRNAPHTFPDLVPQRADLPELEIKTALETNSPKGHLAKAGVYLTFRYVLGSRDGSYSRGKVTRGKTAWIWEIRVGPLDISDFSISNTAGDSGKTAVIKTASLKSMALVYQDNRFIPYARAWG
jgi:transcriptional regulator with XRE-family HTH domain